MLLTETKLNGAYILEPKVFRDKRGWFVESWSKHLLEENGIDLEFVQDNHSFSAYKGTLRGMHFQRDPKAQAKLIRCTKGIILDVAVDIRNGSPTFGDWISLELSAENMKQLFIQKGFAHGFLTLTNDVEIQYKTDEYYSLEYDSGFAWDDSSIGIKWGIEKPVLSEKDKEAPLFINCGANFEFNWGRK